MSRNCRVVRQNDQMCCSTCGLYWDVNDEDVPECPGRPMNLLATEVPSGINLEEARKAALREIENTLKKGE